MKVLIVEDDPFLSEMYSTKLVESGFEIDLAGDGQTALEKMTANKPDLVLLDIVLPKIDGFEVLKKMKNDQNLRDIRVIALTNLGQKEEVQKGLDLGAEDYIIKAHFTPSEVVAKIREVMEKKL
ncbi:MAG: response regulator [Candidatus Portnoybacteria bacterium]|nr:response regulator [Candidatus Portnoybacteria bacterium]